MPFTILDLSHLNKYVNHSYLNELDFMLPAEIERLKPKTRENKSATCRMRGGEEIKRKVMKTDRVNLTVEDIGPLEKTIEKYASMGSGLIWYKGVGWDLRMAIYALEDLKARRHEYKKHNSRE